MKFSRRNIIIWIVLVIPYLCLIPAGLWYFKKLADVDNSSFVIINKADMTLYHYDYKGNLLQKSKIATGKKYGNKIDIGDFKTPEGIFRIGRIQDASSWSHDFKDDTLGPIKGAYGPYFISLDVPGQKGIGIHGTHDDNSIGTRASEGCIRMHNTDLVELVDHINTASIVVITPGIDDLIANTDTSSKDLNDKKTTHKSGSKKIKKGLFLKN